MNLNKVFIAGRLTADPLLRSTASGQQVGTFSLATNRVWTNPAGQKQEAVEYHNVVVWGKQADTISRFLTKGSLVLVEGRLQTRAWDDKQGQKRRTTEIIAERVQFGPRSAGGGRPFDGGGAANMTASPAADIPTVNLDEPAVDGSMGGHDGSTGVPQDDIKPEDLPF